MPLIGSVLFLTIIGIAIFLLTNRPSEPLAVRNHPDIIVAATPAAEDVPLYPSAKQVETEPRYKTADAHVVSFDASAGMGEVTQWYSETLRKSGWEILSECEDNCGAEFVWSDPEGKAGWNLDLDVSLFPGKATATMQSTAQTHGVMWIRRTPISERVPAYPGAQATDPIIIDEYGTRWNLNAYLTEANPLEVEAYYRAIMPQYGWIYQDPPGTDISQGVGFGWRDGSVENLRSSSVRILATKESDGRTKISIRRR